jgi:hypothetical protein
MESTNPESQNPVSNQRRKTGLKPLRVIRTQFRKSFIFFKVKEFYSSLEWFRGNGLHLLWWFEWSSNRFRIAALLD